MNLPSHLGEEHLEPRVIVARVVREHAAQLAGEADAPGGAGGDLLAGDEAVIQPGVYLSLQSRERSLPQSYVGPAAHAGVPSCSKMDQAPAVGHLLRGCGVRGQSEGVRVAVAGVGYWGSRHVRVLRSTTGVAAVIGVDQRFTRIGNGSQEIDHGVTAFPCIEDALPHVDAVVIATPPASHATLGMKAIEAGKHVLIEKPMATTAAAANRLIEAASAAGVLLMPGHTFEHNAAVHKLRELVRTGQLGQLFYLDCARLNLGLYQADVNVILDLAPHDISISNFVLDSRPTTVTVWASRHVHPEHEDVAYLRLDYAELGIRTNIHVSWLSPDKVRQITAVGSKKMAVYNDMTDGDRIRVYDKSAVPPSEADGPLSQVAYHLGDIVSPFVAFAEPLAVQDQHFVDCIANGSLPSVDGSSGLAVVQALECAQMSLQEQRPVALAEVTGAVWRVEPTGPSYRQGIH